MGLTEASQLTSLSPSYLRRHSVGGLEPRIPFRKIGGKIKFLVRDLEAVIAGIPPDPNRPSDAELAEEIRQARAGNISDESRAVIEKVFPSTKR
jgi:hypothetical protein